VGCFGREKKLSKFAIAASRQYCELEHCLDRSEKWVMKDGPVIPKEMLATGFRCNFRNKSANTNKGAKPIFS